MIFSIEFLYILFLYFEKISYIYQKQWNYSINIFLSRQSELSTMTYKLFGSLVTVLALLVILSVSFPIGPRRIIVTT